MQMKKFVLAAALLGLLPGLAGATEFERLTQFVGSNPTTPAAATPMTLGQLLATARTKYPEAVVTGRFSDPRSVSIYRSHPGLHYGYDVAMPAGTVVPAAWEGEVVAITPWYGQEEGISVVTGSREATYGHLIPLVKVGQKLKVGDPVGIVARDHVDVKMRGPAGEFIDYGAGEAEYAVAPVTPEERNRTYLYARYQFLRTQQQLKSAQAERQRVLKSGDELTALKAKDAEYARLYQEGAIARIEYENMHKKMEASLKQAKSKPARLKELAGRIESLTSQLSHSREQLAEAQKQVSVKSALSYLNAYLANHPVTKTPAVASAKPMKLAPLRPDLDELLEEGVISLQEYRQMGGREKAFR
ncbi:MAG: peptidoglycan DD-metalloendopeptidase family protein [Candidatus Eremiobacteraeota bacterium]|nr:peptidoglycan DD-metalloendopeptidase family protein [Candidatus Eremiobacteraeota bacterium]